MAAAATPQPSVSSAAGSPGAVEEQDSLIQQLEAARDGKYYVKRMSRGSELCLGWRCWKVTFCAFSPGQSAVSSGEGTLLDRITEDIVPFKEAVTAGTASAYFRLVVPSAPPSASSSSGIAAPPPRPRE